MKTQETPHIHKPITNLPKSKQPISQISIFTLTLILSQFQPSHSSPKPPPIPILPLPTTQQLQWQLSEMALFLHFGPNTFTDTEWGTGHADPSVFDPTALNATQWVTVAKENGFSRVMILAQIGKFLY